MNKDVSIYRLLVVLYFIVDGEIIEICIIVSAARCFGIKSRVFNSQPRSFAWLAG